MDIASLSSTELNELIRQASGRLKVLKKRKPIAQVRAKVAKLLKAEGYTAAELFGGRTAASAPTAPKAEGKRRRKTSSLKGQKVPAKYRNPENPEQTWTGRGQKPLWIVPLLDAGRSLDEFLIR